MDPQLQMNDGKVRQPELPEPPRNKQAQQRSANKAPAAPTVDPQEYGRLELRVPLQLPHGGEAKEVVFKRPKCRQMMEILDTLRPNQQVERFVEACVRAIDGSGEAQSFPARMLHSMDGAELSSVITAMSEDAERVVLGEQIGDGITQPLIYTLQWPISMRPEADAEVLRQFAFMSKTIGDISEFLDAGPSETKQFSTFMHCFGQPQIAIPIMTDQIIGALDFLDYLVIRRQIFPKFTQSRSRWRRTSSLVH